MKNIAIFSVVGFVLFTIAIARMTESPPSPPPDPVPVEETAVPLKYQAVAAMRRDLIRHYVRNKDEVVSAYTTLRDFTVPSVMEYGNALMRIIPTDSERDRHALLISDMTRLKNAIVNLKNAYVTQRVVEDMDKLDAFVNEVDAAIKASDQLWGTSF